MTSKKITTSWRLSEKNKTRLNEIDKRFESKDETIGALIDVFESGKNNGLSAEENRNQALVDSIVHEQNKLIDKLNDEIHQLKEKNEIDSLALKGAIASRNEAVEQGQEYLSRALTAEEHVETVLNQLEESIHLRFEAENETEKLKDEIDGLKKRLKA